MIGKPALVNPREGRRFVIADVHGCVQTLRALVLDKIKLQQEDQLFMLGDYLNRGPDSAGVLDFILSLLEEGCQVLPLLGNHETYLLSAWSFCQNKPSGSLEAELARKGLDSQNLLTAHGELKGEYQAFLQSLPYFYVLDRFLLVHSGFNFRGVDTFTDTWHMTHLTTQGLNPSDKTIVYGHEITPMVVIKEHLATRNTLLPLDNGCYLGLRKENSSKSAHRQLGHLCCLDLDTMELFAEANAD